jgi:hypothetical protein
VTDDTYYYHRAEAELEMAQRAENTAAVRAHYELANRYLDRVYGEGEENKDSSAGAPTAKPPA